MSIEWWGTFTIPEGRAGRFRVGPLVLTVARLRHEWQVSRHAAPDGRDVDAECEVPTDVTEPPSSASVTRYATDRDTDVLRIVPILPDRTVLSRPARPLTLLPHTEVTLYVGSPVWVRLLQGKNELIGELPVSPPKEAWLGPNTREGELCYATRTAGRLELGDATIRPHRVISRVAVHNESASPFVCERVNLPVRRLSVFGAHGGRLFTESVTLVRASNDDFAQVRIGKGPPDEAGSSMLLSGPREPEVAGAFRAFGSLFG